MTPPHEIPVSRLSRLIGTPAAPVIIDVCIDEDFNADPRLVPTSIRQPHSDIGALVPRLAGADAVVICQKGLKLSQGAAAILRAHGIAAGYLEGGIFAWRDAGQPLIPADRIPAREGAAPSLWVTGHDAGVDQIACSWLVRRFIDRGAQFLFVESSQVADVARRFAAVAFGVEGAPWSRRGETGAFDTMLEALSLNAEPLKRLAKIVQGADTNRRDPAPEAAGLRAASFGYAAMYEDELERLEAGFALYDALYRWARESEGTGSRVAAHEEPELIR